MLAEIRFPFIDPVLLDLPWAIDIRWYGLMYVVGFLIGGWLLGRLCLPRGEAKAFLPMPKEAVSDLIFWLVLGLMLGARIGYLAIYKPALLAQPSSWLAFWDGGMSFHGGLVGVLVAFILFARKQKVSAWLLMDGVAMSAPPGLFAVRCANFINGELYGRVAGDDVPWAMRFPTDPVAMRLLGTGGMGTRERELITKKAFEPGGVWDTIAEQVPLRHPSQLYEALGEGIILSLFLLLVFGMTARRRLPAGWYGALFLMGYGIVRFVAEFFRQPDEQFRDGQDQLGTVLGPFSMGQVLCGLMIVAALGVMVLRRRRGEPAG